MYPNFVITLCDRWKEASMPKPSWIHPVVSMQITAYDGRTDGQTDDRIYNASIGSRGKKTQLR